MKVSELREISVVNKRREERLGLSLKAHELEKSEMIRDTDGKYS